MTMFKFGLVRTLRSPGCQLSICGSCAELGNWDPKSSLPLSCASLDNSGSYLLNEPTFWSADVAIEMVEIMIEYKFIALLPDGSIEWEGCGSSHNRVLNSTTFEVEGNVAYVSPAAWRESSGVASEFHHTTQFYLGIASAQDMHLSQVTDRIWLGSCPRQFHHIAILKALGISAIINLQLNHDVENNSYDVLPYARRSAALVDDLTSLFADNDIRYVWLPTADMSTAGRIRMLPHAVYILHGLIQSGHTVYVHCNAGVGRSTAVVCGYLLYVDGMTFNQMQYFVKAKRPCVYIDEIALRNAGSDYRLKFGSTSS